LSDDATIPISIDVADETLARRLAEALKAAPGLRIARPGETADATLIAARAIGADDLQLTPREVEVLALLAEGASNKEIARRLGISVHTAKFHVGSLIDKLEAIGRTDAVAHAARRGVIHL
jgi:DNA-binding CsgD family transcriptional regulator